MQLPRPAWQCGAVLGSVQAIPQVRTRSKSTLHVGVYLTLDSRLLWTVLLAPKARINRYLSLTAQLFPLSASEPLINGYGWAEFMTEG